MPSCRRSLAETSDDAFAGLQHILAAVEGRNAEKALAMRAKTGAGGDDEMRLMQQFVEKLPAPHALRRLHPHVRSVLSAPYLQLHLPTGIAEQFCIAQIVVDESPRLLLPFRREESGCSALHDVARAIELGGMAAAPEFGDRHVVAGRVFPHELVGDDDVAATHAGESALFGEGTELNGALARPRYGKNGCGDLRVGDEGLVSAVVKNDGVLLDGVVHPFLELFAGGGGSGGVIR